MLDQRYSDNDQSKRDIPSFIEPMPPLISNPFMRPRPQKGTNLLELFEEDSETEEPELVQVYLRLKPYHAPNNLYEIRSDRCLITSVDTATAGHGRRTQHNVSKMYTFSHIFGPGATQKEVFENVVKDNLKKLPEGHNFTLLTYGASGSGKTYTLMGTVASPGLVPRSLEYVFRVVDAAQQPSYKPADGGSEKLNIAEQDYELQWVKRLRHVSAPLRDKYRRMSAGLCNDFTMSTMDLSNRARHYVWVSFVEIYNEGIYDLLASSDRRNASKLRIREDASGNVYVKGITQAFVRSGEEAYDVMVAGKHNLQVAATGVHAESSRSHCIFTITMLTETEGGVRSSCVRLCDLAGCERARRTRNTGARMAESRAINSSLHVLERCLHTLRRRQRRALQPACVPYRESKLTRLLGAGLSGARGEAVSMVVTLNPAPEYAHETKHVLQLAAVARDIQVNNTIAESTLESSTQDTTVSSGAGAMKLRSDNERLHFELLQAQSRNKELLAAMEEKQQEAATTMRELVEEAKDMTRQYYEAQMQALRSEMEDMIEEYESRLSKAAKPVTESGTPSRSLQKKVAELMTEVAILEEKLTAEKLARARAEEEVQHLRACIEERDEKENASGNREDVMLLTDSEHDSEEEIDDPCNESLEPTFKKEDINKSRLLIQNTLFDQNSIHSEINDNSARSNHTMENENSVLDKSGDILKEDDTDETTKDSMYATGDDDSASINKTNETHDTGANDTRNVSDMKLPVTQNEGKRNVSEYNQTYDNQRESLEKAPEKIEKEKVVINVNNEYEFLKPTESAPRGTYFIRSSKAIDDVDESIQNLNPNKPNSFARGTYCVNEVDRIEIPFVDTIDVEEIPKEPLIDSPIEEITKPQSKVSETVVSKIIKSIKSSHGSNSSLAQFEQLEIAANICDETKADVDSFGCVNLLKGKRNYFDSPKVESEGLITVPKLNKEKKTYFDSIDVNIEPPSENATEINNEVNNQQFDDTRSPSIVKDEMITDFTPSAIKKLLGKSFSRQPEAVSSVQKVKVLHKKHESVDIFEGLDSPRTVVKTPEKIDVVEQARISIDQLVLEQKSASKAIANLNRELKLEQQSITEEEMETALVPTTTDMPQNITNDILPLTISPRVSKEAENISKVIPSPVSSLTIKTTEDIVEALPETEEKPQVIDVKKELPNETIKEDNTIEEFDNLYKDISASRATEFELLVSQSNTTTKEEKNDNLSSTSEEIKYNLRHKSNKEGVKFADKLEKGQFEEVLLSSHAKCESKVKSTKRSLRLRRRKNQSDEDQTEQDNKLKDIVNLQKEFSDVTMDVPAPVKVVKDIQSPEKPAEEVENVPPLMGIQSCPSKSVTRSRRKLFTPRAEPLDESLGQPGDSTERVYVPRPSYHRARARRKL